MTSVGDGRPLRFAVVGLGYCGPSLVFFVLSARVLSHTLLDALGTSDSNALRERTAPSCRHAAERMVNGC